MSRVYEFTIICVGNGTTPEEAWDDAKESIRLDADYEVERVTRYTMIEDDDDLPGPA